MKTLCMDTSHRYLVLALIEDKQIIQSYEAYAWKKQSETIFVELINLMDKAKWNVDDLDEMIITTGPGSYTGIRIAMSIAKVVCSRKHIALKTLSTLQLYAGLEDVSVILDARSNRVYYGKYKNGNKVEEGIKTIEEVNNLKEHFIGDVSVLGKEDTTITYVKNFVELMDKAKTVEHIHQLVPTYLKEEDAYLVKKP